MRKRKGDEEGHSYAATENIILDYRLETGGKEYIEGDVVRSDSGQFRLHIKAIAQSRSARSTSSVTTSLS